MSVIQPQYVYVGQNTARPDFKTMTRDINARIDMVRREKQQQRQFEIQRQDQLNREFLKSVNVDQINFTNNKLKEKSVAAYNSLNEFATDILAESEGRATTQDIMKVQSYATSMQQEMMKYKNWEDNWRKDMAAISSDTSGKLDKEAAKKDVFGWDGETPYNESRLKISPWDKFQTQQELKKVISNANEATAFSYLNGQGDIKTEGEWVAKFWESKKEGEQVVPVLDENGNAIPNYKEQGKYIKGLLGSNSFSQARIGLTRRYDKLSKEQQKRWDELAANNGLLTNGQGDGEIMYMLSPDGEDANPFQLGVERIAYRPTKKSGKSDRESLDVREGYGNISGSPVKLTGKITGAVDTEGNDLNLTVGLNDALITNVEYTTNPKTGNKEWMARGVYDVKGGGGMSLKYDEQGRAILETGAKSETKEFLVPYSNVKEPIENEYIVKGMAGFKPPKEDEQIDLGF